MALLRAFLVIAAWAVAPPLAGAAAQAGPDSTASSVLASVDSLTAGRLAVPPDSLATGGMAASADSLTAPPDSLAVPASVDSLASAPRDTIPDYLAPWVREAQLDHGALSRLISEGLDDPVEIMPGASLRVAGDRGFQAFVNLSPVDGGAPEIMTEDIPSRSPADLDPGLWDRSGAVGIEALASFPLGQAGAGGGSALYSSFEAPRPGETALRAHFSQSRYETFLRALNITTPRARFMIRYEYEEWKTEDGYNFTGLSQFDGAVDYGKSKMRHWRIMLDAMTGLGRTTIGFGRGTRFARGSTVRNDQIERWTGEVWAGLDRQDQNGQWRLRAYNLDWHVDDRTTFIEESNDATRIGVSVRRSVFTRGLEAFATWERWTARFDEQSGAGQHATPPPQHVGRFNLGYRSEGVRRWRWSVWGEAAYAEHARRHWDGGGHGHLRYYAGSDWWIGVEGGRSLRTPTMLESFGLDTFPMAGSFSVSRMPGDEALPFEVHQRARVAVGRGVGRFRVELGVERWWLRDGIGWLPESITAVDQNATTLGGLSTETDQATLTMQLRTGSVAGGFLFDTTGHYVLGELDRDVSRGGGWPEAWASVRIRWWHVLLGPRDFVRVQYRMRYLGRRYDDLLVAFSQDGQLADDASRHDVRLSLQLRNTEVYVEWRNFPDLLQIEVEGTRRRGWDLIWGVVWPFYN